MRKIKLYGELGAKFGKEFKLQVSSPAEAFRALSCQVKGFKQYIIDSEKNGIYFRVFCHRSEILSLKELSLFSTGEIRVVPTVAGANGEFRALVGAALIVSSYFVDPTGATATFLLNTGVALSIGGAAEILTRGMISNPQPPEKADNKPSYSFQGAVNTMAQGHPVPVGYGKMIVGGAVISASITTESLLAGYVYQTQESYKDIWSYGYDTNYQEEPPPNYTRRVLLQNTEDRWEHRYYYNESVLALRSL